MTYSTNSRLNNANTEQRIDFADLESNYNELIYLFCAIESDERSNPSRNFQDFQLSVTRITTFRANYQV